MNGLSFSLIYARPASLVLIKKYKLYDQSITFYDSKSHISARYKQVVKLLA